MPEKRVWAVGMCLRSDVPAAALLNPVERLDWHDLGKFLVASINRHAGLLTLFLPWGSTINYNPKDSILPRLDFTVDPFDGDWGTGRRLWRLLGPMGRSANPFPRWGVLPQRAMPKIESGGKGRWGKVFTAATFGGWPKMDGAY